jgi:hypothetical protein
MCLMLDRNKYYTVSDTNGEDIQGDVQFWTLQNYSINLGDWSLPMLCGGNGRTGRWDCLNCMRHNLSHKICMLFSWTVGTSSFSV